MSRIAALQYLLLVPLAIAASSIGLMGQIQWSNFGPPQRSEVAYDLVRSPAEGHLYYLADADSAGIARWAIYKLDSTGQQLWKKSWGTGDAETGRRMIFREPHLYIAGFRRQGQHVQGSLYKVDTAGKMIWDHYYGHNDTVLQFRDIRTFPNGDMALLGQYSPSGVSSTMTSLWRIDTSGQVLWKRYYSDTTDLIPQSLTVDSLGNSFFTCDYQMPSRFDLMVYKVGPHGQFLQRRQVSNGFTRGGNDIGINGRGQLAITGEGSTPWSVSFDITLTILDSSLQIIRDVFVQPGSAGNDACFGMSITPDDHYLITGYRISPEGGTTEMTVLKSDSMGQLQAQVSYSSSNTCIGVAVEAIDSQRFVAAGNDHSSSPSLILALGSIQGLGYRPAALPEIAAYPQPAGDWLQLNWPGDQPPLALRIYSAQGKCLRRIKQPSSRIRLDFLPSGVYFLRFHFPQGQRQLKVVKK